MTGFHQDEDADWVAELECGHNQHVRHRPPFQMRDWVVEADGRAGRIGSPLECPLCDRGELPEAVRLLRTGPVWDENSLPAGLRRQHHLAARTWGRLTVHEGRLRLRISGQDLVLVAGDSRGIPPDAEHDVEPLGPVRLSIEFLGIDRTEPAVPAGGDPACWAGLVCVECGAMADGDHRPGCARAQAGSSPFL